MEKRGKHFSLTGMIAGILAAGIVLSCAGCSSAQDTMGGAPLIESAPVTAQPTETVGAPDEIFEAPLEPVEPSSVIEMAAPSRPGETPSAEPAAAAEPSANVAETTQAGKGLPSLKDIGPDTVVDTGTWTAYDFRTSTYTGLGLDGTVRPFEMYYGIYAEVNGSKVTYRAYSHLDDVKPVAALIKRTSTGSTTKLDIGTTDTTVNMAKQANDVFTISVKFSNDTVCAVSLYFNDGTAYIVSVTSKTVEYVKEFIFGYRDELNALIDEWGVTPENSIGVTTKDISYPTYARNGYRCDTDLWRALAHEIVEDDTLGDTVKLALLHDWMTENMAYDNYMVNKLNKSRANYYRNWSGPYNVYDTKAGKCTDFANALAIMARELGIPCTSIENDGHTWNVVYANSRWYEIDMTGDIQRHVYGADVTNVSNPDSIIHYDDFMTNTSVNKLDTVKSLGKSIYTEKFAKTGKD